MKMIKCPFENCGFATDDASKMAGHLFSCHTELGSTKFKIDEIKEQPKKTYKCKFCGAVFDNKENAENHILENHKEELEKIMNKADKKKKKKLK